MFIYLNWQKSLGDSCLANTTVILHNYFLLNIILHLSKHDTNIDITTFKLVIYRVATHSS